MKNVTLLLTLFFVPFIGISQTTGLHIRYPLMQECTHPELTGDSKIFISIQEIRVKSISDTSEEVSLIYHVRSQGLKEIVSTVRVSREDSTVKSLEHPNLHKKNLLVFSTNIPCQDNLWIETQTIHSFYRIKGNNSIHFNFDLVRLPSPYSSKIDNEQSSLKILMEIECSIDSRNTISRIKNNVCSFYENNSRYNYPYNFPFILRNPHF